MSRKSHPYLLLSVLLTLIACSNDFDINGDFREEIVVYGLLDCGSDTNFIRIQKTFLTEGSALASAADPGSNFYLENELTVYLLATHTGGSTDTLFCEYVDGDTLGIEKPDGIFSSSPNILYRITSPLDSTGVYQLQVIRHTLGDTISATTKMVHPFYLFYPTRTDAFISYADTGKITYNCKQAVNGIMYDLVMRFTYAEKNAVTGDSVLHTLDWEIFKNEIGTNAEGESNISYRIDRKAFYSFLASSLSVDPNVTRYALYLQFDWYSGGTEIYDLYLNNLANLGINQDYISPEYTNINGGIGIFSSIRRESAYHVNMSEATIDSIACGTLTKNLRFVTSPANPAYPGCGF